MTGLLPALLAAAIAASDPHPTPPSPSPTPSPVAGAPGAEADGAVSEPEARPDDKTLVVSLDVEQGDGKDRVSLYRDGTLALVRTYAGVRTLKRKVLSVQEVELIEKVCLETVALDVAEYRADVLGSGVPRTFRLDVATPGGEYRTFSFDELAGVPLALGRARGAMEGLLDRFDEKVVSEEELWDPASVREGDVLVRRTDERLYRVVRDDAFVRSVELLEVERNLERLVVLREEIPKLFQRPSEGARGEARR